MKQGAISRRAFLKTAGAGALVLALGGGLWRAAEQGVFGAGRGPAYEPWSRWQGEPGEGPLALVRAAILAANPANAQPWLFRLSEARIDLFADPARHLPALDPEQRNLHIGLGCALENLLLAGAAHGYACRVTLLPTPTDPSHVATIDLAPAPAAASDLYRAIPDRHTHRGPYNTAQPVPGKVLQTLQVLADGDPLVSLFWLTSEAERRRVGELIVAATEAIIADAGQIADLSRWLRFSEDEVQRQCDGLTLDTAGLSPLALAAAKMLPPPSPEEFSRAWLRHTREVQVRTAAAFGIITVRDRRDRAQQLGAGRYLQRIHLWATGHGLALQVLQQLPDRAAREESLGLAPRFGAALQELVGDPAWQAVTVFRLGHPAAPALRSPRRGVEAVTPPADLEPAGEPGNHPY